MNLRPLAHLGAYTAMAVVLTAGAAQSLAGSNTVYGDDIVNGTVKSADIGDGTVTGTDIANGTITGADVADNSLKGADIDESSLGTVPSATNATKVGGHAASDFVQTSDQLFAVVGHDAMGQPDFIGRGVTGATNSSTGQFNVTFNRDISSCSTVVSASPDSAGTVTAVRASLVWDPMSTNVAEVLVTTGTGSPTDAAFVHVQVSC